MLHFSRLKTMAILAICILGVLLALPNAIPRGVLPSWMPQQRFTLGLDLQGGSYLLLQVDMDTVNKERLDGVLDGARQTLREAGIPVADLAVRDRAIELRLSDPDRADEARKALRGLLDGAGDPTAPEFATKTEGARITITPTEAGLRARANRTVQQSIEIVRRRIDQTGVAEPVIAQQGQGRVLVQLPGVDDPDRIKRLLGTTAKMTFHLVGELALPGAPAPAGFQWIESGEAGQRGQKVLVKRKVELDGASLIDARAGTNQQTGEWIVSFEFDAAGAKRFGDITKANVGKPFAIVLDGKVISAPVIREPITGGRGQISGSYTVQSANELAVLLRAGALPAPLKVVEERTIGPDLGADAIRAGIISVAIGLALVVVYMVLTYGLFGLFADVALIANLFLTLACLSVLEATLTLPGIAGILLTLGMSLDANILINERIREETRKGKTPTAAMEAGFTRAFATITDANMTTLIKMALLYAVGTGTVRGFAVTISLGILVSMFTSIVVARLLMVTWLRKRRPTALPVRGLLHIAPEGTRIAFMKGRFAGLGLSVLISAASVALFFHPGLNYGVDFAGGTVMEVRTQGDADFPAMREALGHLGVGQVQLQQFGSPSDVLLRFERQIGAEDAQQKAVAVVQQTLQEKFPGVQIRRVESVGASVSAELFHDGMMALALASIAMLAYIWFRFEWQFGVGAVVTMLLDVTKTIGFFAITGLQFNLTAIAAILTIMGFSINDKVVVYDRVRENLRLYRKMPLRELIDRSINETLTRTISTNVAVFLAVAPLALHGGESLQEFALVLLFGVVLATSSSIFIAAPILLLLGERRLRPGATAKDGKEATSPAVAAE